MAELLIIFDQTALNEEAGDREIDLTLLQSAEAVTLLDELSLSEPEAFMRAPTLDENAFADGEDDEPVEFSEESEDWHEAADGIDWARSFLDGLNAGAGQMSTATRQGLQDTLAALLSILELAETNSARFHFYADE